MPNLSTILYYCVHVQELRAIIQWSVWHQPVHERDEEKESLPLKHCFVFLDKTSRSFASVIKELHPELLVPVCLFYLILRGLDTIEDDMSIDIAEKEPLLRNFYQVINEEGWTYEGNHAKEKDRELLVKFHYVTEEFNKIKPEYQAIIRDVTEKMGNGMADYAKAAVSGTHSVDTIRDYELYCHYVAGLVGEGCTRLFVEAKLANPALSERTQLQESMGQFLQQTNIVRDVREDRDDKRIFWPKEVWSKYVPTFEDLFKPENKEKAMYCSSEMVLLALQRADDCLFYLAGIKEQSVFNFCAIPQSMAIATLELCFNNPAIFERNVKIRKGQACGLMVESTQNLQLVCEVFRQYARKIHRKNNPQDPNFLNISIACGKIEKFIESIFPSQTPRTLKNGAVATEKPVSKLTEEQEATKKAVEQQSRSDMIYVALTVFATLFFISACMIGTAWFFGARFDIAYEQVKQGVFGRPGDETAAQELLKNYDGHGEL
ncbi:bifunctional farnesyl-diphosphate farnesyltransferase/squalene synthase [Elasticomyces elasticus]|nr:bifunctional farnesyl-diphosphate farnesyltransferase/squalene synthase [Elasticomyces elasticus]